MSASVLLACELNEQKLPGFVLLKEEYGADASFLVTSLVGNCLKFQQNAVQLVCLQHTSQHYINAAARLGYNLSLARDQGRIIFIDPLADIGQNFLSSTYISEKEDVLDSLLMTMTQNELKLNENIGHVTTIIDNITVFADLGLSKNSVLQYCHKLINLTSNRHSIVLKINTSNLYDDFVTNLEFYADSNYLITKMKSGEFHEVDGKIVFKKRTDFTHIYKTILYKVGDRNIKIFQPGEVGIKP